MMKVTVVGYWHGYPEKGEATSGYLLQHDHYNLLLDCGSGVLSQLQKYCSVNDLNAIVLSHYHHDHQADIGPFQYARIMNKGMGKEMNDLTIYGHRDEEAFVKLAYHDVVKATAYDDQAPITIGPFTFHFFKTQHPVPCYAMRIECQNQTVVYTADSSYFDELADFAKNADLLITECSGYASDPITQFGHMTSTCVGKLAAKAKPKHLLLSHLPHHGDHEQLRREVAESFNGTISLAKSGLGIRLL